MTDPIQPDQPVFEQQRVEQLPCTSLLGVGGCAEVHRTPDFAVRLLYAFRPMMLALQYSVFKLQVSMSGSMSANEYMPIRCTGPCEQTVGHQQVIVQRKQMQDS